MDHRLLFIALLALPLAATAQLAPQQPAPLYHHLIEVNKEWQHMDPSPAGGERTVQFAGEAERIATHLRLVREHLLAHTPEGLSAAQFTARHDLLNDLANYAARGLFPQNDVLPMRNPVFIDPQHTACAVGQLMIESGHAALAKRISREMNLAYVREMEWPEIGRWANEHGFTAAELAWIQPAYSPPSNFFALGGGTDTTVTTLCRTAGGQLILGGEFTSAGTTAAQQVTSWDGSAYAALGSGVSGTVRCALEHNGLLYLGGQFQSTTADLAVWDGSTWTYQNIFPGMSPMTHALAVHNGQLHAAGESSGFSGTSYEVRAWDGAYWINVGNALNGPVLCLERHDGHLVIGGAFTGEHSFGTPNTDVQHVAVLDSLGSSWVQYVDGLDATVYDLLNMNGTLYAGGSLYNNIVVAFGLARLSGTATAWEHLLPNHPSYMPSGPGPTEIRCLAEHDGGVYFGGSFNITTFMSYGQHMGLFSGMPDYVMPLAILDAPVNDITVWNNKLILGGEFTISTLSPVPHVAYMDLASGVEERPGTQAFAVWPNPAVDQISFDATSFRGLRTRVLDATGREVIAATPITLDRVMLNVSGLAPGAYRVAVFGDGGLRVGTFMRH